MTLEQQLQDSLTYDPETGEFFWKLRPKNQTRLGARAGRLDNQGYIRIGFKNSYYLAHRVAWLIMTGSWPTGGLDHANCIKSDNKWSNIRLATPSENNANWRSNRHLPKGVTKLRSGRYQAQIKKNGKGYYLGVFRTPEEAGSAYISAAKKLYGKFARAA